MRVHTLLAPQNTRKEKKMLPRIFPNNANLSSPASVAPPVPLHCSSK
jgi:hypothetical protein